MCVWRVSVRNLSTQVVQQSRVLTDVFFLRPSEYASCSRFPPIDV